LFEAKLSAEIGLVARRVIENNITKKKKKSRGRREGGITKGDQSCRPYLCFRTTRPRQATEMPDSVKKQDIKGGAGLETTYDIFGTADPPGEHFGRRQECLPSRLKRGGFFVKRIVEKKDQENPRGRLSPGGRCRRVRLGSILSRTESGEEL